MKTSRLEEIKSIFSFIPLLNFLVAVFLRNFRQRKKTSASYSTFSWKGIGMGYIYNRDFFFSKGS